MRLRRIAYIVNAFPQLSETFIAEEVAEVLRRGVFVEILSLRMPEEKVHHEVVTQSNLLKHTSYDSNRFLDILREFKPDILHAHFATKATKVARELSDDTEVPFTFTAHRYDIYSKAPADFYERANASAGLITVSEENARYISETFGVPRASIHVCPCGVDTKRFRPSKRKIVPTHIVCVARLKAFKNQRILLEACSILRSRKRKFRCILVGDGPTRDELYKLREELRLEEMVQLVGPALQSEVLEWWQKASIGVLPSDSEGMPVCLMEAAACGVPVVATTVGGIPEMIEDGVTGFLTPPGDAPALAEAIERLLLSPKLIQKMGVAARYRAAGQFSVVRQVDQLVALWTDILNRETKN